MNATNKVILAYLSKLYSIAKNTSNEEKLLDNIEENCYDMLEYINQVRRRKMKNERRDKGSPFGQQRR